jgi:hypothetical protein
MSSGKHRNEPVGSRCLCQTTSDQHLDPDVSNAVVTREGKGERERDNTATHVMSSRGSGQSQRSPRTACSLGLSGRRRCCRRHLQLRQRSRGVGHDTGQTMQLCMREYEERERERETKEETSSKLETG